MRKLINVMKRLRSPQGCPWDRKQTFTSLSACLLEESSEVIDAILENDYAKVEEELGDLLCIISMLIVMGEEQGKFDKRSVVHKAARKMIRRHPHVFGGNKAYSADEAFNIWHKAKSKEKNVKSRQSVLEDISLHLPALSYADKIGRRIAKVGFDWEKAEDVLDKVEEEIKELRAELHSKKRNKAKISEELGDLFFALANLGRKLKLNSEIVLRNANKKFIKRFKLLEKQVKDKNKKIQDMTLSELEKIWQSIKKHGRRDRNV